MQPNELEKAIVERILVDPELAPTKSSLRWDEIKVKRRSLTNVGFLTEFEFSEELMVFASDISLRWGKIGARLNETKIETGYLVYVDGGYITTVEGYTYGDEWPRQIDRVQLYDLKEGADLENPP
jgi:hypothetical protein